MSGIELAARLNRLDPEALRSALDKALRGLDLLAAFIVGSAARGKFVRGASDLDVVAVVYGTPPYRGKVVGTDIGDVEVVVFSLEEWCAHRGDNPLVREAAEGGIAVWGDAGGLEEMCKKGIRQRRED